MYEYRIVEVRGIQEAEDVMNEYVKDGWKVISNSHYFSWGNVFFITFERNLE